MMKKTSQMLKRNKKEQEKKEEEKLEGPKFSCLAIFYEQIKDDDKQKYRKIIIVDKSGRKYRQIFSGYAIVVENILPYNNKRTYRSDQFLGDADYQEKKRQFKELKKILRTDNDMEQV